MAAALENLYVRIANDVVHDLSAAVAIATPYAGLVIRVVASKGGVALPPLAQAEWDLIGIVVLALGVLIVTGSIRLRYWRHGVTPNYAPTRARAAIIKHSVFVLAVIGGLALGGMAATALAP